MMKHMRRSAGAGAGAKRGEATADPLSSTIGIPCWEHPAQGPKAPSRPRGNFFRPPTSARINPPPREGDTASIDHRQMLRLEPLVPMRMVMALSRCPSLGEITIDVSETEVNFPCDIPNHWSERKQDERACARVGSSSLDNSTSAINDAFTASEHVGRQMELPVSNVRTTIQQTCGSAPMESFRRGQTVVSPSKQTVTQRHQNNPTTNRLRARTNHVEKYSTAKTTRSQSSGELDDKRSTSKFGDSNHHTSYLPSPTNSVCTGIEYDDENCQDTCASTVTSASTQHEQDEAHSSLYKLFAANMDNKNGLPLVCDGAYATPTHDAQDCEDESVYLAMSEQENEWLLLALERSMQDMSQLRT